MQHHPSSILPAEDVNTIRHEASQARRAGQLTHTQLQLIYSSGWFLLFVPKALGGLHYSLPDAVRLQESIAWADGSMGWVVTLCAGAGLFSGYLDKRLSGELFSDPKVCLAGSGQVNGIAKRMVAGFEVNGSWDYSSGAPHATHFTANCRVEEAGSSSVHSFVFKKEEVTTAHNWNYIGLNATGGHSFAVDGLTVEANRSFLIDPLTAKWPDPVYRYPFLQLAQTTIAANISGMCLYFLELAGAIVCSRASSGRQVWEEAIKQLQKLREQFYAALDDSWYLQLQEQLTEEKQLNAVSSASLHLADQARYWVDLVYPHCGLTAARTGSTINEVWRDIHTASQHRLLTV